MALKWMLKYCWLCAGADSRLVDIGWTSCWSWYEYAFIHFTPVFAHPDNSHALTPSCSFWLETRGVFVNFVSSFFPFPIMNCACNYVTVCNFLELRCLVQESLDLFIFVPSSLSEEKVRLYCSIYLTSGTINSWFDCGHLLLNSTCIVLVWVLFSQIFLSRLIWAIWVSTFACSLQFQNLLYF